MSLLQIPSKSHTRGTWMQTSGAEGLTAPGQRASCQAVDKNAVIMVWMDAHLFPASTRPNEL